MDAMFNWLWQGGVVAVAWLLMLLALEHARANVRYIVCWAASLVIMALPAVPLLQSSTTISATALPAPQLDAIVSLPDAWWTSTIVMLAAWVVWASIQVIRFISAIVAIRRARARSRAFPPHVESVLPRWRRIRSEGRRVTLVLSDAVTTAAVLGWGAPMIAVAPSLLTTLDADELDRVLIHEWAHVQRRDDLVHTLQNVIRVIAGWHPALWWIDRRLHVEREIACDEIAVALTGSPKSYAECLMKLACLKGTRRAMQMAPAVLTSSTLRARVIKIVSPHRSIAPVWSRSIAAAIVTTLCFMCVGLGGLKLVQATTLALPFVSARMLSTTPDRLAPVAVPMLRRDTATEPSPRRPPNGVASAQRPKTEQSSRSPQPETEPDQPPTSDAASSVDSTRAAEADVERAVVAETASAPDTPERPDATAAQPRSPWTAAASGGTALGRKSKDAGVATAGFFTRFARRVAGSF
jgi:bla regulator protein blaR1